MHLSVCIVYKNCAVSNILYCHPTFEAQPSLVVTSPATSNPSEMEPLGELRSWKEAFEAITILVSA